MNLFLLIHKTYFLLAILQRLPLNKYYLKCEYYQMSVFIAKECKEFGRCYLKKKLAVLTLISQYDCNGKISNSD